MKLQDLFPSNKKFTLVVQVKNIFDSSIFVSPISDRHSDNKYNLFLPKGNNISGLTEKDTLLVNVLGEQLLKIITAEGFERDKRDNKCLFISKEPIHVDNQQISDNQSFFDYIFDTNISNINYDNYDDFKDKIKKTSFFNQLDLSNLDQEIEKQLDLKQKIADYKKLEVNLDAINQQISEKISELQQVDEKLDENKLLTTENTKLKKDNSKLKKESSEFKALKEFHNQNTWLTPLKSIYENTTLNSPVLKEKTEKLTDKYFKKVIAELKAKQVSEDFINTYLLSLFTCLVNGRFLLLTGHIGTGKSSLIKDTGPLLGGNTTLIPVRPGWIDSSDLLGFYDPINSKFRVTEFTHALQQKDNDLINIILLDEMNIARIENYAADILSCHNPIDERQNLNLYQNEIGTEQHIQLAQALENLKIDSAMRKNIFEQLPMPSNNEIILNNNVLLCGTLNIDGSTENLPPKMIDRSFILKFPDFDGKISSVKQALHKIPMSIQSIIELRGIPTDEEVQQWDIFYEKWIIPHVDILLPISHRIAMDYILFQRFAKTFKLSNQIDIYFVYARILPRLQFTHTPELYKKALSLITKLSAISGQKSILNMLEKYEDKDGFEISYQYLCG